MLKNKLHVHNLGSQKVPSDLCFQFGSFFGQFNKGDLAISWLCFTSEDLGVLSTSDAGSFVAEESYAGQANSATAAAREGCCRGWYCGELYICNCKMTLYFVIDISALLVVHFGVKSPGVARKKSFGRWEHS